MVADTQPDSSWSDLLALDADARVAAMRERCDKLVQADSADRINQSRAMIFAEYELEDEQLREFTVSRLRAWMGLAADNLEQAQVVATAYDQAFDRVPGEIAMRRAAIVQTVARDQFTADDIDVLYELMPKLVGHLPRASQQALESVAAAERSAAAEARASRKPWWKFW